LRREIRVVRRTLVSVFFGVLTCAVGASAQSVDSASTTIAPPHKIASTRPTPFSAVWFGEAHNSPSNIFGHTKGRDLFMSAVRIQRPFAQGSNVVVDYVLEVIPATWVSGRAAKPSGDTVYASCPRNETCVFPVENAHGVFGFGASPAGLDVRFFPDASVQPFFSIGAGAVWFHEPVPVDYANRFNFLLNAGAGILVAPRGPVGVILGYRLAHISNGGTSPANPGLDNHILYVGLVRAQARSLTNRSSEVSDSEHSVVGSARVSFDTRESFPGHGDWRWSISGSYLPFVSEHWQLGLAPSYDGFAYEGGTVHASAVTGQANLTTGGERWRGYVGSWLGVANGTSQPGQTFIGAHVGALRFFAPTSALRAELRWRRSSSEYGLVSVAALLTIDSYIHGRASEAPVAPALGTIDVSGYGYAEFQYSRERSLELRVAPFLSSWAQVGALFDRTSYMGADGRFGAQLTNVFARVYAPLSSRVSPFAHAFVERSSYANGNPDGGPSSYGAMAGVRRCLNAGTALDVGIHWRRHTTNHVGDIASRIPDETTLQAGIVTQLQLRRR
jgi:lipid A 3-O-deacylase PagL